MQLPSMIKGWFNPSTDPDYLLQRYVSTRNAKYLNLLVQQFNLSLYHYLLSQSDKEMAEDVLQTVWLKVISCRQSTAAHSNVKSWLYTIARHCLIDEFRRQAKWQTVGDEPAIEHRISEQLDAQDKLVAFNQALTQLPFLQREAFILQQEGFSVLEICQLTEASFETVKSRLRYARASIQQVLESLS